MNNFDTLCTILVSYNVQRHDVRPATGRSTANEHCADPQGHKTNPNYTRTELTKKVKPKLNTYMVVELNSTNYNTLFYSITPYCPFTLYDYNK